MDIRVGYEYGDGYRVYLHKGTTPYVFTPIDAFPFTASLNFAVAPYEIAGYAAFVFTFTLAEESLVYFGANAPCYFTIHTSPWLSHSELAEQPAGYYYLLPAGTYYIIVDDDSDVPAANIEISVTPEIAMMFGVVPSYFCDYGDGEYEWTFYGQGEGFYRWLIDVFFDEWDIDDSDNSTSTHDSQMVEVFIWDADSIEIFWHDGEGEYNWVRLVRL